jgi:hypothetical protein
MKPYNEEQTITNYFVSEAYNTNGYIVVNKNLIQILGLLEAIVLGNYISKSKYFQKNNPENDDWFFLTHESQMEELNLGERVIRRCKQELIQRRILEIKSKGIPAKEWLRINLDNLAKLVRGQDLSKREGKTFQNERSINNNKYNNNKIIKRNITRTREESTLPIKEETIIPPSLELVNKYCQERKNKVNPKMFIDFYSSKGWLIGKNKMKNWKAAIRTWEMNESSYNGKSNQSKKIYKNAVSSNFRDSDEYITNTK